MCVLMLLCPECPIRRAAENADDESGGKKNSGEKIESVEDVSRNLVGLFRGYEDTYIAV